MKLGHMFVGKHVEPMRPVNQVDENLMRRIAEAKQRLIDRNIEPVALLRVKPEPEARRPSIARRTTATRLQARWASVKLDRKAIGSAARSSAESGSVAFSVALQGVQASTGVTLTP